MQQLCLFLIISLLMSTGALFKTPEVAPLEFAEDPDEETLTLRWSSFDEPYLVEFRERFNLEEIIHGAETQMEKVIKVNSWVSNLWDHHGYNQPRAHDPISILEEVQAGQRFRCTEYAIVVSGALNALGIPARILALKTSDADTRKSGAGHVVAEAYLEDLEAWIFIDGQWNAIPVLNGQPLSAVEFQAALAQGGDGLQILSFNSLEQWFYLRWIAPYLYYMDSGLDNRVGPARRDYTNIMLIPRGAPELRVFQVKWPIENMLYTSCLETFYSPPDL